MGVHHGARGPGFKAFAKLYHLEVEDADRAAAAHASLYRVCADVARRNS